MTFAVIIEVKDGSIGKGNPPNGLTKPIVAILILINIVPQMKHIVDRVFAYRVSVSVEKAKGEITTGVNGKANVCDGIICCRRRLGAANDRSLVGAANAELIVILGEWAQVVCLNLGT